jgi:hypothetical protein
MNVTVQAPPLYRVVVTSNTYTVNVVTPTPYAVTLTGVNTYKLVVTQTILQGPKGDKGDTGDTGPQGIPGLSGGLNSYSKVLPDDTDITIPASEHNLSSVAGVTVLKSDDQEVDVYKEIKADRSVIIKTNLSFQNYKITIF